MYVHLQRNFIVGVAFGHILILFWKHLPTCLLKTFTMPNYVHMQKSLWQIHDQNYLPRERKIQLRPIIKSTRKQISVGRQIPIYDNLRFRLKTIRDDDGLLLLNSLIDAATAMIAKMIDLHCKNLVNGLKGLNDRKFAIPLMKWNFTHFIPMHNFMHWTNIFYLRKPWGPFPFEVGWAAFGVVYYYKDCLLSQWSITVRPAGPHSWR